MMKAAEAEGQLDEAVRHKLDKSIHKLSLVSMAGKTMQDESRNTSQYFPLSQDCLTGENKSARQIIKEARDISNKGDISHATRTADDAVMFSVKKKRQKVRSPRYIGSELLWMAKLLMYDFLYNCLWKTFSHEELSLIYTDTDSFYIHVHGVSSYHAFLGRFDPTLRTRYFQLDPDTLSVGKFKLVKLEMDDVSEIVCLGPKLRSAMSFDGVSDIKAKGVTDSAKAAFLRHKSFLDCIEGGTPMEVVNPTIRVNKEKRCVENKKVKLTLCGIENKQLWLNNNECVPYGYFDEEFNEENCLGRIWDNWCTFVVKVFVID